jgi:hypothetical protein
MKLQQIGDVTLKALGLWLAVRGFARLLHHC